MHAVKLLMSIGPKKAEAKRPRKRLLRDATTIVVLALCWKTETAGHC
jgi:hypothetical protein